MNTANLINQEAISRNFPATSLPINQNFWRIAACKDEATATSASKTFICSSLMLFHPQSCHTDGGEFSISLHIFREKKNNIEFQFFTYGVTYSTVRACVCVQTCYFSLIHVEIPSCKRCLVFFLFYAFATNANWCNPFSPNYKRSENQN